MTALPVALAVVLGAALSGSAPSERAEDPAPESEAVRSSLLRFGPGLYAVVAVLLLAQPMAAHRAYDLAVTHPSGAILDLRHAVERDPSFPLYRARGALFGAVPDPPATALRAAEGAHGVAALWLLAGRLGAEDETDWAEVALLRACELDPLAAAASYQLARVAARDESLDTVHHAARALLAEPKLAAAPLFQEYPGLGAAALDRVRVWPAVDEGFKVALLEAAEAQWQSWEVGADGEDLLLTLSLDGVPAESPSLYLFHRRPWPGELATIHLLGPLPELLDLPAAPRLRSTARGAFDRETCGPQSPGGTRSRRDAAAAATKRIEATTSMVSTRPISGP